MRLESIGKAFGETNALTDASLIGLPGEIHAIVGENGSGKSTLIKVAAGIHKADRGRAEMLGASVAGFGPSQMQSLGLAAVFQEVLVADGASVLDNIFVGYDGLFRRRLSYDGKRLRATEVLNRLNAGGIDLEATAGRLSLSERQLVTMARALVRNPRVLILDESTSALDLAATNAVAEELDRLKAEGVCVLLVTHRIAELSVLADRATVLRDGRSVGLLTRDEFSEQRMLELMSGQSEGVAAKIEGAEVKRPSAIGPPLLSVSDARLDDEATPFDFGLGEGEIVGFAGLEGQGQVEFLRGLAGIEPLEGGHVEVHAEGGSSYSNMFDAARQGIAYVSGDRKGEGTFPDLSIRENFALPGYRRASTAGLIRWGAVRRSFAAYRDSLKMRLQRDSLPITSLSGGNQQKVLVARWLALEPRVLLLNDPTRGVDIGTKRDLYAVLRSLAYEKGVGVIFLSTEIEELIGLCDRILVFRERTIFCEVAEAPNVDDVLANMFGSRKLDAGLGEVSEVS